MKIRIEDDIYEGSPAEIIDELRDKSFHRDEFPDTESFLCYMRDSFVRLTDMPCELPEGALDERACAMLETLVSAEVVEILESD